MAGLEKVRGTAGPRGASDSCAELVVTRLVLLMVHSNPRTHSFPARCSRNIVGGTTHLKMAAAVPGTPTMPVPSTLISATCLRWQEETRKRSELQNVW